MIFININQYNLILINILRKVGALPEYSSWEGCRVEVQDSCEEAGREFGRLVIHRIHLGIALWSLSFWVRACGMYIGISLLGVPQTDDDADDTNYIQYYYIINTKPSGL